LSFSADPNYTVRVTNPNGCDITSNVFNFTTLGIDNLENELNLPIYPNPSNNILNVECKNGYQIFNSVGQLVKQNKDTTNQITISDLPTGLYILKSDNRVGRFIKSE
jgi:hypothetical protein